MTTPRITRYLQSGEHLQPIVAKAQEISALSKSCLQLLPPELVLHVRGANIREDMLVIHAANPAVAAKLKMLAGALSESLRKQGSKVKGVSVRVQPAATDAESAAPHKMASMTPVTLAALDALREGMADGPARRALDRLLAGRADSAGLAGSAVSNRQKIASNRSPKSSTRKNTTRPRAT